MARRQVHNRKPPRWPWLIGLGLLLVALWLVSLLLDPEGEIDDPARLSTEGVEAPEPVTIPAPAN